MGQRTSVDTVFGNFNRGLIDYYEITGIIINKTPLHIGSGTDTRPGQAIDSPIIRLPNGEPYIPGSSLKGVLRSILENYLITMVSMAESSSQSSSSCVELFRENNVTVERFIRDCPYIPGKGFQQEYPYYCINHGLFGGPSVAGHIIVYDLILEEGGGSFIKPGVAIDRFLGASYIQALYNIELVVPNTRWKFKMRIYGLDFDSEDKAWKCAREALAFLLEYISIEGFHIGGRVSVGQGYMVFSDEIKVRHVFVDENGMSRVEVISFTDFMNKLRGFG